MIFTPPAERVHHELSDVTCNLSVVLRRLIHLGTDALVGFAYACAIIALKATRYFVGYERDTSQMLTVELFRLGTHACNREDLLIFLHALLELAEEDTKT